MKIAVLSGKASQFHANENGENIELKAEGLSVRAFCHEIDHLYGILFIDKIVSGT